ncbi:hypothetical protein [Corynebacterium ulcerans]|uniref:hypothetical protein n=1 Tax=Corynebacterium ulcerans TaxID=65058 RepID=UPI00021418D1|nr:hypothetical protein [Corynebacterium ulcerans]AEG84668.1 hypothetical protein CULC22_01963 [Corynebacterium ulcerans BR-AD22]
MPSPHDMPTKARSIMPTHVTQSITEITMIFHHWIKQGVDVDNAVILTEITANNIKQGEKQCLTLKNTPIPSK